MRYLRRIDAQEGKKKRRGDVLDAEDRAQIESIFRQAVTHAAIAGTLFGLAAGLAEALVRRALGVPDVIGDRRQLVHFWEVYGAIVLPLSMLEIFYMWTLALRAVHRLSRVSGLVLTTDAHGRTVGEGAAVASVMARAALELPNPKKPILGVDPMREASRLQLALASLAYKLKAAATKFVFKAIVRRLIVRVALRAWAPLVAAPITAAWSAIIVGLVLREARVRALGASAVHEMVDAVFAEDVPLGERGREAALRAVASCIVRSRDLHPNLVLLLAAVRARAAPQDEPVELDDPARFLAEMSILDPDERRVALRLLAVAAVVDGRLSSGELRLLRDARIAVGETFDEAPVRALQRAFLSGLAIAPGTVRAIA